MKTRGRFATFISRKTSKYLTKENILKDDITALVSLKSLFSQQDYAQVWQTLPTVLENISI